jgi:hypothetical protein
VDAFPAATGGAAVAAGAAAAAACAVMASSSFSASWSLVPLVSAAPSLLSSARNSASCQVCGVAGRQQRSSMQA